MVRRSDTTRLWGAILALSVAVGALFAFDSFAQTDDVVVKEDLPFVAFFARYEIVDQSIEHVPVAEVLGDEVLGEVVVAEDMVPEARLPLGAPEGRAADGTAADDSAEANPPSPPRGLRNLGD